MGEVSRRGFLAGAAGAAGVAAGAEKVVDGGFAEVSLPGVPKRKTPLVPPGAGSLENFGRKCVACQACVEQCPTKVLRPSMAAGRFMQPEMGFERGYCRVECVRCGRVCPTGAIREVKPEEKLDIHLGHAIWRKENCLSVQEGVKCDACAHKCPVKAIVMIPMEEGNDAAGKVPAIDKLKCIGCGACEHVCPARPEPAITVKGFERHREVKPMGDADVLAEAKSLIERGKTAVVLVKGGVIVASHSGRGLSPLLNLMDRYPEDFRGAWVIDKVIGRAAAGICAAGGAKRVHGLLMSDDAAAYLGKAGIGHSRDAGTEKILNRAKDGRCPLELSVDGLEEPGAMVVAIRKRIAELRAAAAKAGKK